MAESESGGEKTEEASGKRLEEAREKGQIAKSPEFATAAFLLGFLLVFSFTGPQLWRFLLDTMGTSLATAGDSEHMGAGLIPWMQVISFRTIVAMLGAVAAMAVVAVAVQAAQTGGLLTTKTLAPKFERLNPMSNAGRILGKQSIVELAKALLKMMIVGYAVYMTVSDAWPDLQALALNASPMALLEVVQKYGFALIKNAGMMFLVLAMADYGYQRWKTMEDLKMTKQEVKEEHKSQEGNPEVKGRRRAIARERIRRQMFAAVPKADVIIVNPVHIAIAIKYDPNVAPAPYVVALGERKIAQRIKELAFQHGVPVIENKPLARALIKVAKVGTVIPVEMYLAVAEVLAFVMRQRERYGAKWRGTVAA
ncbi:MAG TPA: flagellar type III secretion system protein FlhB [Gemmatimonas aurantiaca]|uniref:Flagellar biosynthesis protein FlhB n=2 Tax=Gemmatimonas aurantiaca TaxID=173480 RepID=C1A547_GEMAT|nr:EscU/YscU/HrcU family type III secretion system export apparatus switch protein [Gemmatimonas aurantiaca]BAH37357.1 flagellar biosynthesis protein FlhB [Gemmatimonas aurantiaca T-27]HCT55773.1 flagellar type III secretion system protein FlhB [Gemmatimonas aurantiaca]